MLELKHRLLFPHIHFERPNPDLALENSPFYITKELKSLKNGDTPLIAGVSSFGVGGTNAHILLKEAPAIDIPQNDESTNLLILSAKTVTALEKQKSRLMGFLRANPTTNLSDLAYTLQLGRGEFAHRMAFVARSVEDSISILDGGITRGFSENSVNAPHKCIFLFTGQGKQYTNMGRELYDTQSFFKAEINKCLSFVEHYTNRDYKNYLYPSHKDQPAPEIGSDTSIVQPLLFCFEYALAKFLMHLGIHPHALLGYSFGEITAACLADVVCLEDAIKLVIIRGELMKNAAVGSLISIPLPAKEVIDLLRGSISVAVDNGASCIVSGYKEEIEELIKKLKERRIICIPLNGEHVAHSPMLSGAAEALSSSIQDITFKAPRLPLLSCVEGDWMIAQQASSRQYWAQHMLKTIKFYQGVKKILEKKDQYVFIEIGPGRDLSNIVQRCTDYEVVTVDMIQAKPVGVSDHTFLLHKIGCLWSHGVTIQWHHLYAVEKRRRIHLPTYPFEKQCYASRKNVQDITGTRGQGTYVARKKEQITDWFYLPSWKRMPLTHKDGQEHEKCWVVLAERGSFTEAVYTHLTQGSDTVIWIEPASAYKKMNPRHYRINIADPEQYVLLFKTIKVQHGLLLHIIDLLPLGKDKLSSERTYEEAQQKGLYSLVYVVQALSQNAFSNEIRIMVVTDSMQGVLGNERLQPEYATVVGTLKVINQEYININCSSVDIQLMDDGSQREREVVSSLLAEFKSDLSKHEVAYRGKYRWIKVYEPFELHPVTRPGGKIQERGTYVITGGLGRIGYELAAHLLENYRAHVAIVTRTELRSSEEGRPEYVRDRKQSIQFDRLKRLQILGNIRVFTADISNIYQMEHVLDEVEQEFGRINGLIHAAGMTGKDTSRSLSEMTASDFVEQLKPKMYGTWVLHEVLRHRDIDFCLLLSSLSPLLGGLGYGGYAAGNSFLDAFVYYHNSTSLQPWICVNWETWMSEDDTSGSLPSSIGNDNAQLSMTRNEGIETFERIVQWMDYNQIVVSSGSLEERIQKWVHLENTKLSVNESRNEDLLAHSRPQLLNPYIEPRNDLERRVCRLWQRVLGIQDVGVTDNFFELGGDSLKLLNTIGAVYREFYLDIPVAEFFHDPTITFLARKIETSKKATYFTIPLAEQKAYYALSSAQKRMYYVQSMSNDTTTYNETTVFILEGQVDRERLAQVFGQIIERYEILRTSFAFKDNQPVQIVHDTVAFTIEYAQEDDIDGSIRAFIRPFDLSQAPLIRVGLIQIAQKKYVLVLDMHHIITDGVSEGVLVREFMALYDHRIVSEVPIQYKDYAEWQAVYKNREYILQQEVYWLKKFQHGTPQLNLSYDFNRPALKSFKGRSIDFTLNKETTLALKELSQKEAVTLYMLIAAAFLVFLHKISGDEDIVVGTNSAGRLHPEIQDTIGVFVNTLVLRAFPQGEKEFRGFLREVKEEIIQVFEHQEYQFDDLVDKLVRVRDGSRNPLFDVLFVWQNMDIPEVSTDEIRFIPYEYHDRSAKFDLSLMGFEVQHELYFKFEYSSDLFEEKTVNRFIDYFQRVLAAVVRNPKQPLRDISLLSQDNYHQLAIEWNATNVHILEQTTVDRYFEEQALRHPEKTAVSFQGKTSPI